MYQIIDIPSMPPLLYPKDNLEWHNLRVQEPTVMCKCNKTPALLHWKWWVVLMYYKCISSHDQVSNNCTTTIPHPSPPSLAQKEVQSF